MNARIRIVILFEYCKRSFGKSDNPEMHFYVIPELREIDNDAIKTNAIYLIDNNFVRGGIDDDGSQTFPWIRRITSTGMVLIEKITDECLSSFPKCSEDQIDKTKKQDKILRFITECMKTKVFSEKVLSLAKNLGL